MSDYIIPIIILFVLSYGFIKKFEKTYSKKDLYDNDRII